MHGVRIRFCKTLRLRAAMSDSYGIAGKKMCRLGFDQARLSRRSGDYRTEGRRLSRNPHFYHVFDRPQHRKWQDQTVQSMHGPVYEEMIVILTGGKVEFAFNSMLLWHSSVPGKYPFNLQRENKLDNGIRGYYCAVYILCSSLHE